MATAVKLNGKCPPKRRIERCFRKKKSGFAGAKNVLKAISSQLTGINTNLNNNLNNLSSVISNTDNNLNNNLVNSLNSLNTNLSNTIETNTNTVISNMNNAGQEVCTVQSTSVGTNFDVPCGTTRTYFENLSTFPTETVFIRFRSFIPITTCRPILVIVTREGTVIEEPILTSDVQIRLDNYASISVRCETVVVPPPADAGCAGFVNLEEVFCVCC